MVETWMGVAIGGSALAVALTTRIAHYWLEWRRSRLLRNLDHHDWWYGACGTRMARRPARIDRRERRPECRPECSPIGGASSRTDGTVK